MRFQHKPKEYVVLTDWHVWFAWHPVRVGDTTVFFEKVWRKGTVIPANYAHTAEIEWEYRFFESEPPHPTINPTFLPPPVCP